MRMPKTCLRCKPLFSNKEKKKCLPFDEKIETAALRFKNKQTCIYTYTWSASTRSRHALAPMTQSDDRNRGNKPNVLGVHGLQGACMHANRGKSLSYILTTILQYTRDVHAREPRHTHTWMLQHSGKYELIKYVHGHVCRQVRLRITRYEQTDVHAHIERMHKLVNAHTHTCLAEHATRALMCMAMFICIHTHTYKCTHAYTSLRACPGTNINMRMCMYTEQVCRRARSQSR